MAVDQKPRLPLNHYFFHAIQAKTKQMTAL